MLFVPNAENLVSLLKGLFMIALFLMLFTLIILVVYKKVNNLYDHDSSLPYPRLVKFYNLMYYTDRVTRFLIALNTALIIISFVLIISVLAFYAAVMLIGN